MFCLLYRVVTSLRSLVCLIPLFRISIPLPEKIAMELASLPDYFVSDVAEFLLFVNM